MAAQPRQPLLPGLALGAKAGQQTKDAELQTLFKPVAEAMVANEAKIVEELNAVQGKPSDIDGYYRPDEAKTGTAMRPSATLNAIVGKLA